MASRVPVRTLKSVDLPTFGRPTSAMTGSISGASLRGRHHPNKCGANPANSVPYPCPTSVAAEAGSAAVAAADPALAVKEPAAVLYPVPQASVLAAAARVRAGSLPKAEQPAADPRRVPGRTTNDRPAAGEMPA